MAATVFRKGQFASGANLVTNHTGVHAIVKRRWNDGSPKHVILAGLGSFASAGAAIDVTCSVGSPSGTNLTSASITAAVSASTASVSLGALGSVSLSSLVASPHRTWVATPNMVECHYVRAFTSASSGNDVFVWFHVRYWTGGRVWVRVVGEFSRIPHTTTNLNYSPEVTIGGTVVWRDCYVHANGTRWSVEGWVGTAANVSVRHDPAALRDSRMLPNYFAAYTADTSKLNALVQSYTPGSICNLRSYYPGTGYDAQIGILPEWDMLYAVSGDVRAWRSLQANSLASGSHATIWRDPNTRNIRRPSNWANWTLGGANQGGYGQLGASNQSGGTNTWDTAHNCSSGYMAYLVTGDFIHLETLQTQCAAIYFFTTSSNGAGPARIVQGQTRAVGWYFRTAGQLAGIAPDEDMSSSGVSGDMAEWLYQNMRYHKANGPDDALGSVSIGYPLTIGTYNAGGPLTVSPWMHHFWIQSMGHVSELEPLSGSRMTEFNALRDWMYQGVVGNLGDGSAGTFDYRYAGQYNLTVSSVAKPDYAVTLAAELYDNWGQVFSANPGLLSQNPTNSTAATLWAPHFGYWNNLLPAIAYAVDHNASGAAAAWARITSATNWNALVSAAQSQPVWAVEPR